MGNITLLIFAFSNVFPQLLHPGTVRRHRTRPVVVRAFGSVAKEKQSLLLVSQYLLAVGGVSVVAAGTTAISTTIIIAVAATVVVVRDSTTGERSLRIESRV